MGSLMAKYLRPALAGLLIMLLPGWKLALAQADGTIEMYPGEVRTLPVGSVEQIAVGNEQIAKVSALDNGDVLVIAQSPGETDLVIWTEGRRRSSYALKIGQDDTSRRHQMVRSALSEYPVTTREVGGRIIVEGEIAKARMERFDALVEQLPGVVSQVRPDPVTPQPMISIKAQIVEVDQEYRRNLGIDWPSTMSGPTVAAVGTAIDNNNFAVATDGNIAFDSDGLAEDSLQDGGFDAFAGITTGLTSTIQLLHAEGAARTLAEPTLVTRSGEPASFLSGGEVPYQSQSEIGVTNVQFREFGIQLDIVPRTDGDGNILAEVEAEVSTLDFGTGIEGVPGLDSRRASSVVNVKSGQTILISGLVSTEEDVSEDAIPYLKDLPILGELFTTTDRNTGRRELIILVTPRITGPGDQPEVWQRLQPHMEQLQEIRRQDTIDNRLLE